MQTMQKFSYINQMNGFLDRMSEDTLPANAVILYLMLFKSFNRTCWRQEWMKFTILNLLCFQTKLYDLALRKQVCQQTNENP